MKRRELKINIDNINGNYSSRIGSLDFYGTDPANLIANIAERYPTKRYRFKLDWRTFKTN